MNTNIRIQLLTLLQGQRLIRLEDEVSGISVERNVDPQKPLVTQKAELLRLFKVMLENAGAAA